MSETKVDHIPNTEAMRLALDIGRSIAGDEKIEVSPNCEIPATELTIDHIKELMAPSIVKVREWDFGKVVESEYYLRQIGSSHVELKRSQGWKQGRRITWNDAKSYFFNNNNRQIIGITHSPKQKLRDYPQPFHRAVKNVARQNLRHDTSWSVNRSDLKIAYRLQELLGLQTRAEFFTYLINREIERLQCEGKLPATEAARPPQNDSGTL